MTTSVKQLAPNNTDDVTWRAWVQGVVDGCIAAGLVEVYQTSDLATAVKSGTANTRSYIKIFRFNDGLQATKPVFIRMRFGNSSAITNPGIGISVGTSWAVGASTIGGMVSDERFEVAVSSNSGVFPCYFSGDGSFFNMSLWPTYLTARSVTTLVVDRTRNPSDGTINGDGVICLHGTGIQVADGGRWNMSHIPYTGTVKPADDDTPSIMWPSDNLTTAVQGADMYLAPLLTQTPKISAPILGAIGHLAGDIGRFHEFMIPFMGAVHTYLALGDSAGFCSRNQRRPDSAAGGRSYHCLAIRWE